MTAIPLRSGNPFATRWVRPGAVPFFFPPGDSVDLLVQRLRAGGWRGQIIGQHGTGKSTLLAALLPEVRRAGRVPIVVTLHDGRRSVPPETWLELQQAERSCQAVLVVVDSYERLTCWQRLRLRWRCWARGHGLLVTAHTGAGLPHLYHTEVTPELANQVVAHLLTGCRDRHVCKAELAGRLAAHGGNLREALFDLYDLYEVAAVHETGRDPQAPPALCCDPTRAMGRCC